MFQSGEHQNDAWSYVAALHTDRAHPHVHVVVNNRGTLNDSWFFMGVCCRTVLNPTLSR